MPFLLVAEYKIEAWQSSHLELSPPFAVCVPGSPVTHYKTTQCLHCLSCRIWLGSLVGNLSILCS